MVPFDMYSHHALERNTCLRLVTVEHGGHLGFLARSRPRFWLDALIVEWLSELQKAV
jgi:predicted alpha/beta-fold hydrolase